MPLDPDQMRTVSEWIQLYYKKCPVCGDNQVLISMMVAMPELGPRGPARSGGLAVVPITCKSCGHVLFVNATALQMAKPSERPRRLE